jgi:microcystin-dependent protein
MSITQNQALFVLLGTTYGGDGVTTFALPDLRGRTMISMGQGPGLPAYVIGQAAGAQSVTLTTANLPQHNHIMLAEQSNSGTKPQPENAFLAESNGADSQGGTVTVQIYGPTANTTMNANSIGGAGGSQPVSIEQPYQTINVCIALMGVFPSQG